MERLRYSDVAPQMTTIKQIKAAATLREATIKKKITAKHCSNVTLT